MNLKFRVDFPWLSLLSSKDVGQPSLEPETSDPSVATTLVKQSRKNVNFDINLWGWSLLSLVPWVFNRKDGIQRPTTINKGLKRCTRPGGFKDGGVGGNRLRFRPYVSKVPWHTGARGFLSQLFPRYGHYCGPNWSSGKDSGSLVWDKRPIDWLDYCCYCHDMGYDTHDQAKLLEADLAFLECLERPHMAAKGNTHIAQVYRTMCITGLKNVLIPYRTHLVSLSSGRSLINFGWLSSVKWRRWNFQKS
ncbi:hypothetical protein K2173_016380 [Erythroxylum novogranatense]|uniref:Phospholipase A2 n=1 Tax=Erythroxylum novogranatense TaxID=1862640 RepID=A0AAV8SGQ5_9ROSI|nr:hypothetical protein K2173_016380 [Erythroxylum novogranatense]